MPDQSNPFLLCCRYAVGISLVQRLNALEKAEGSEKPVR